jgi:hypothetical protein
METDIFPLQRALFYVNCWLNSICYCQKHGFLRAIGLQCPEYVLRFFRPLIVDAAVLRGTFEAREEFN